MTLGEAVNRLDALCQNAYTKEEKVRWLSAVDAYVYETVYATHEDCPSPFAGYSDTTPLTTALYAPSPYDEMYLYALTAKVFFHNGEASRAKDAEQKFNDTFEAYRNRYNALHLPLTEPGRAV